MSYIVPLDKQWRPYRYIKNNLYFYFSTATFVWNRNTVKESSLISFFCGGEPLCELERRPENTDVGANRFAWMTSGSLLQSKITDLILSCKSHAKIWTRLHAHVFSVYGWLLELTYFMLFFSVIFWSHLRTEISVILSTRNKLHSRHTLLFFSLSCETTLLMLSCDKLLYYKNTYNQY